jgi:hypothetical protein
MPVHTLGRRIVVEEFASLGWVKDRLLAALALGCRGRGVPTASAPCGARIRTALPGGTRRLTLLGRCVTA